MKNVIILSLLLFIFGCKENPENPVHNTDHLKSHTTLEFATGFSVEQFQDYKVLTIKSPWPKSEKTYQYALIEEGKTVTGSINKNNFDAVITVPVNKIVVTSTTHIPALELLNVQHTLAGFPDTKFISSEKTRKRIDDGLVRELGENESINTEVLLELRPDVVVGFGIDGNNKTFDNIQKSGIPVIFNGDWIEQTPLGKAEWIKFFGVLYDKEKQADSIFTQIKTDYQNAKSLADQTKVAPTVLSGAMHKDVWYLPSGKSSEAQLLKDAHTDYLWSDTTSKGSLSLNFENVFDKAKNASIWISPSYYDSLKALQDANPHYAEFLAFQNKNVFSFVNTTGTTGGVLYFEMGMARPDLVLQDLIKICHPDLLNDYKPYFFKRLE